MQTALIPPRGLTGSALKRIAIITMTIDHFGATVIEQGFLHIGNEEQMRQIISTGAGMKLYLFDLLLRGIGRIAFPIFCFLLVEGFCHTKDVRKYLGNLFLFALISEIPFDLAFNNQIIYMGYQNIFFTLAIGMLTIIGVKRYSYSKAMQLFLTLAGCAAAQFLRMDYGAVGILIIVCFYVFRNNKKYKNIFVGILAVLESIFMLGLAVLSLIPINSYNGERGKIWNKYAFYFFYPAHIIFFYIICRFIIK